MSLYSFKIKMVGSKKTICKKYLANKMLKASGVAPIKAMTINIIGNKACIYKNNTTHQGHCKAPTIQRLRWCKKSFMLSIAVVFANTCLLNPL